MANLKLQDVILKGSGQGLYTFGDYFLHDMWMPKAKCLYGPQFSVCHIDGNPHVIDIGILDETTIKLAKTCPHPIKEGSVINFASAVMYGVEEINAAKFKCKFLRILKASTGKQADFAGETLEHDIPSDGLIISKLKKKGRAKVGHSMISGEHATVTGTTITDTSSNGTYVLLKLLDELEEGRTSQVVKVEPGSELAFADFVIHL